MCVGSDDNRMLLGGRLRGHSDRSLRRLSCLVRLCNRLRLDPDDDLRRPLRGERERALIALRWSRDRILNRLSRPRSLVGLFNGLRLQLHHDVCRSLRGERERALIVLRRRRRSRSLITRPLCGRCDGMRLVLGRLRDLTRRRWRQCRRGLGRLESVVRPVALLTNAGGSSIANRIDGVGGGGTRKLFSATTTCLNSMSSSSASKSCAGSAYAGPTAVKQLRRRQWPSSPPGLGVMTRPKRSFAGYGKSRAWGTGERIHLPWCTPLRVHGILLTPCCILKHRSSLPSACQINSANVDFSAKPL